MAPPAEHSTARSRLRRGPGRPPGRSRADGVIADREALLDAAEAQLRAHGPGVSLDAIARAAGVTKPTLYRELGDKDALVEALSGRLAARMAASIQRRVEGAVDPREGTRNLVAGYLELAAQERALYLFVTAGGNRGDRVQQALLLADGAAHQLAEPIAAFRAARGADPEVARIWSYGIVGALHFATLWWLREESGDPAAVIEQIGALLWAGIGLDEADSGADPVRG